jgi:tetratricopeptide (TPR) repeat protein
LDDGRALRLREEFAPAAALFREVTAADGGNPTAWFELGEVLRRKGDLPDAAAALDKALALAPTMPEALTSRGMVCLSQKKEDQGAAYFEKALRADPTMILALNPLAAYHLSINHPAQALPLLDRATHEGFANAETYLLQMRVHLVQGKWDDSQKDFKEAMSLSTNPPATLKAAADIFVVKEMFPQGIKLYEEGIRRFPDYGPNYLTLAGLLIQAEQPEKALPLYKKALTLDLPPQDRQIVQEMVDELEKGPAPEAP